MCHHYERAQDERTEDDERAVDADAEEDDWMPDGFEEERDVEVDLLTDGGDDA